MYDSGFVVSGRRLLRCGVLVLPLLAVGCGSPARAPSGTTVVTPPPVYDSTRPEAVPPAGEPGPAASPYADLLRRAETASSRGDHEQALALLERAQRIDPGNADIYLRLAHTYSARGDAALARATAERGLLYCDGAAQCAALRRYLD
jgi:tetratricopeptide (TPR) repeat protein